MMGRLRTDAMAVACIVGGAAVSGVATYAMMNGNHDTPQEVECSVMGRVVAAPSLVLAVGGGEKAVVVAPDVRVHQSHCVTVEAGQWFGVVRHDAERTRRQFEQAMREMERAREIMEARRGSLRDLEVELGSVGLELDLGKQISEKVERALAQEMERLEEELDRLDDEIGR